jgi:hypothetical protein
VNPNSSNHAKKSAKVVLSLRELADQLGHAGRMIANGIVKGSA